MWIWALFAVALYVLSVWTGRRLARLSKYKFLMARGIVNADAIDGSSVPLLIAFFHPFCNAGGGGERVLWTAIKAIQDKYPDARCIVYTGDIDALADDILSRARSRFNICIDGPVDFVYLKQRRLIEDKTYPHLTLLMQSLGSLLLGIEAFACVVPDIYIDTMGYAFTFPLFKWLGSCKVIAYVHYPTISSDMLEIVEQGTETFNNRSMYARNAFYRRLKLFYYRYFAGLYSFVGQRADAVMVNSTWTANHINEVWDVPDRTFIVYPPCDTGTFAQFPLGNREAVILSIGQFRPEKNHELQLTSFFEFRAKFPVESKGVKLVLLGGCRNVDDEQRVYKLKELAHELGIGEHVAFEINASFSVLQEYLRTSLMGVHTMMNEHFGIGVVEYMAAGCITVAHKSGGPLMDIVVDWNEQPVGFLANSPASFANSFATVMRMNMQERTAVQEAARDAAVYRFSEQQFVSGLLHVTEPIISSCIK